MDTRERGASHSRSSSGPRLLPATPRLFSGRHSNSTSRPAPRRGVHWPKKPQICHEAAVWDVRVGGEWIKDTDLTAFRMSFNTSDIWYLFFLLVPCCRAWYSIIGNGHYRSRSNSKQYSRNTWILSYFPYSSHFQFFQNQTSWAVCYNIAVNLVKPISPNIGVKKKRTPNKRSILSTFVCCLYWIEHSGWVYQNAIQGASSRITSQLIILLSSLLLLVSLLITPLNGKSDALTCQSGSLCWGLHLVWLGSKRTFHWSFCTFHPEMDSQIITEMLNLFPEQI